MDEDAFKDLCTPHFRINEPQLRFAIESIRSRKPFVYDCPVAVQIPYERVERTGPCIEMEADRPVAEKCFNVEPRRPKRQAGANVGLQNFAARLVLLSRVNITPAKVSNAPAEITETSTSKRLV